MVGTKTSSRISSHGFRGRVCSKPFESEGIDEIFWGFFVLSPETCRVPPVLADWGGHTVNVSIIDGREVTGAIVEGKQMF
jgi:hypothetical protein